MSDSELSHDPAFVAFAVQALGSSELAEGLTDEQLAQLALLGQVRAYASGELICDEHERSDEVYLIETGSVDVWLNPASIGNTEAQPRRIAQLQAGQTCGELALLDGGVRSAQLRAGANGVKLVAFASRVLLELCEMDTAIGFRIMRNLAGGLALRLRLQDMRLYSAAE
ncbi:MAG TPA: cyclic nucleotide-binding domain-containing protein [Roseiflexaceae bacterium]|nr:cyclic nucleotide-binding domain-containing protein [Roseiflexaceae bacterium]HMP39306.1 cyclic nucleotide-binding domain-containing protein [Roseiflexaceae bacterium]